MELELLQLLYQSYADTLDRGWAAALEPVADDIDRIGNFLVEQEQAGKAYLPAPQHVLRAFTRPLEEVKVLIVGQDPYPTPGHAIGLAFSVATGVRPLPRSLQNIFKEYVDDLGKPMPVEGDLSPWAQQGVLMLNRVLTVEAGNAGAHRNKGWERVTDQAIRSLVGRKEPLVAVLWGRDALSLKPLLGETPCIVSAHPSPLSARRGFFGSRPFSRANALLRAQGGEPVDWSLS